MSSHLRLSEQVGTWVLYSGDEVPAGGFRCPTYDELQALPRYASFSEASAAWRALPRWKKNLTVILLKEKLESKAVKLHARKRSAELRARAEEIMATEKCSYQWAMELAKREVEGLAPPKGRTKASPELERRILEIMREKNASRGWARALAKRELMAQTQEGQAT